MFAFSPVDLCLLVEISEQARTLRVSGHVFPPLQKKGRTEGGREGYDDGGREEGNSGEEQGKVKPRKDL